MLVCGGNTAFDIMFNESKDATGGILVNKVISLTFGVPLSQKDNILRDNNYLNFTQAQVNMIMPKLACENPRESIFVTSGDMIGKATVWAHWGSWDFTKKYVFDNYKSKSVAVIAAEIHEPAATITKYVTELNQIAARSRTQNVKYNDLINQWFAPYPGYYPGGNGYVTDCTATDALVSCGIGGGTVLVSINGSNVSLNTNLNIPFGKLTIVKSNVSSSYIVGAGDVDAMLVERSPTVYTIVIAQSPLAGSLFTKLYMFNGVGTKHFDYISSFGSQTAGTIVLWKTNWSN
jgi:hypothetical protein